MDNPDRAPPAASAGVFHAAVLTDALLTDDWFASCAPALRGCLLDLARVHRLRSGESLFSRGGEAQGLCCVVAGALRVGSVSEDGRENMLAYLEPYHWFGEISLIDGLPRTHDAVAEGQTEVLLVPRTALLDWLEAHPVGWRDIARLACRKLRVAFGAMEDVAQLPLEQRLLRRLSVLAQGYGSRTVARRRLRLSQDALAQMLGVSRQSVNKALKALEAQGRLRLRYGQIELDGAGR